MRLTRIRFTMRWLSVAVAIISVAIAVPLEIRRRELGSKVNLRAQLSAEYTRLVGFQPQWWLRQWLIQKIAYHDMLRAEYEWAAPRPWVRIPAEPSEPIAPTPVSPKHVMARADLNWLQGSWRVVSVEHDGKSLAPSEKVTWVFSDDELLIGIAGRAKSRARISLGPDTTPKAINRYFTTTVGDDFVLLTERGIYRFDDQMLWVCLGEAGEGQPTEFASKPGSRTTLVVLKRRGDERRR